MELKELLFDVFSRTKKLLNHCLPDIENDHASHILYYLTLFACYLSGKEEAEEFQKGWLEIKDDLKRISEFQDFMNQSYMLESHIEQAIGCESTHKPGDARNMGIYVFYESKFESLYKQAQEAKSDFLGKFNETMERSDDYFLKIVTDNEFYNGELEKDPGVWAFPN